MKQDITYNAYNLIETIKEETKSAEFYYGADELRKRMDMKTGKVTDSTKNDKL